MITTANQGLSRIQSSLQSVLATSMPPVPNHPSLSWLRAVILLEYCAHSRDYLYWRLEWQDQQEVLAHRDLAFQLSRQLKKLNAAILATQEEAADLCAWIQSGDGGEMALIDNQFITLQRWVARTALEVEQTVEAAMKMATLETNETSIKENKAGVACKFHGWFIGYSLTSPVTILAYFFIPLNLASSIFGMNVQEINSTGWHIWVFVLTAVIAVTISILGLLLWRILTNRPRYRERYTAVRKRFHAWRSATIDFLCRPLDQAHARQERRVEEFIKAAIRGG